MKESQKYWRQLQDSNLRGQNPKDFKSFSLTARTSCHIETDIRDTDLMTPRHGDLVKHTQRGTINQQLLLTPQHDTTHHVCEF
jgi:hypothetical protein